MFRALARVCRPTYLYFYVSVRPWNAQVQRNNSHQHEQTLAHISTEKRSVSDERCYRFADLAHACHDMLSRPVAQEFLEEIPQGTVHMWRVTNPSSHTGGSSQSLRVKFHSRLQYAHCRHSYSFTNTSPANPCKLSWSLLMTLERAVTKRKNMMLVNSYEVMLSTPALHQLAPIRPALKHERISNSASAFAHCARRSTGQDTLWQGTAHHSLH